MDTATAQTIYSVLIRGAKMIRFVPKPILVMVACITAVCGLLYSTYRLVLATTRHNTTTRTHRPAPRGGINYHYRTVTAPHTMYTRGRGVTVTV